jgi:hypothetical protein
VSLDVVDFEKVHDRFMQAQRENPTRKWPEILLRKLERNAMAIEVHRAHEAQKD